MHMKTVGAAFVLLLSTTGAVSASDLEVHHVSGNAYAVIGPLGQRSLENLGNNATFGFLVTKDGVVLIDSGGSEKGAQAIEEAIATVTDLPVRLVINTGGQDHRWFGNSYFSRKGARITAADAAVAEQKELSDGQFDMMRRLISDGGLAGTDAAFAGTTFSSTYGLDFGGQRIELRHVGPAHTRGDTIVWLPDDRVVFAGDVVYLERLAAVLPHSDTRSWIEAFDVLAELQPLWVVPGHGAPGTLDQARQSTLSYLQLLRREVGNVLQSGGDEMDAVQIDQSEYKDFIGFENLRGRNAQQVFIHMEWE